MEAARRRAQDISFDDLKDMMRDRKNKEKKTTTTKKKNVAKKEKATIEITTTMP